MNVDAIHVAFRTTTAIVLARHLYQRLALSLFLGVFQTPAPPGRVRHIVLLFLMIDEVASAASFDAVRQKDHLAQDAY